MFGPVSVNNYYSGAVCIQTPFGLVFRVERPSPITPPNATGEPVAFLRLLSASDVATTWSRGPYQGQQTLEQARELLKATLSELNKDPRVADGTAALVTDVDVLAFREWDYFPRFDSWLVGGTRSLIGCRGQGRRIVRVS